MSRPASPTIATTRSSDAELMSTLASGDIGALAELYDRYHTSVRRFLIRATGNADDVDDLLHATFLACAESASRYDGRESCRPWLMGIAAFQLRRRHRAFGRWLSVLSAFTLVQQVNETVTSEPDERTDVERALARLTEPKRITLLLAEVEGLTGPEIASALGIPVGTVWTRLHAARRELRQLLGDGGRP